MAPLTFTVGGISTKLDLVKHLENTGWVGAETGYLDNKCYCFNQLILSKL